jgi:acyl dehydratase
MNYIARELIFQFVRPVFVGDTVKSEAVVINVKTSEGRLDVAIDFVCHNQHGKEVLLGKTQGIILSERSEDHQPGDY